MSAFLGPIHFWMYNKILLQEKLTAQIVALAKEKGWCKTEDCPCEKYNKIDNSPLETVIDESNIHGWLNNRVNSAEQAFADVAEALIGENGGRLEDIIKLAYELGKANSAPVDSDIIKAYETLDGILLDGMPCDGGRHVISDDGDEIIFRYDPSLHALCKKGGNGEEIFASIREHLIKGALDGTSYKIEFLGDFTYKIGGK